MLDSIWQSTAMRCRILLSPLKPDESVDEFLEGWRFSRFVLLYDVLRFYTSIGQWLHFSPFLYDLLLHGVIELLLLLCM
jgi:hypothetical protein